MTSTRCAWPGDDPLLLSYHDEEWGVPLHDDRTHFEYLLLDGAQAGLSWITILRRREAYWEAFDGFDPRLVAGYGEEKIAQLLSNEGIIRNRLKVNSAVQNARAFLRVQEEFGSFDSYIWDFVDGRPIQNTWPEIASIPAKTPLSEQISKDLKKRGFSFVGPTIIYAYMQAAGLVNDHVTACFRHSEIKELG
jgi:DNA-3-methyladenine glycosylase I